MCRTTNVVSNIDSRTTRNCWFLSSLVVHKLDQQLLEHSSAFARTSWMNFWTRYKRSRVSTEVVSKFCRAVYSYSIQSASNWEWQNIEKTGAVGCTRVRHWDIMIQFDHANTQVEIRWHNVEIKARRGTILGRQFIDWRRGVCLFWSLVERDTGL